ncbi:MAG: hypothetical protein KGL90_05615 [Burkholderiales bacterium]|nr:hypothetical protein [Burkholderiales bacterium]
MSERALIPLNRSEHMYWAGEGFLGAISQAYLVRLDRAVDESLVRQALRELASSFPRMRGILVPTAFTYKLGILPDDLYVDQLFDDAYRVQRGVDASSRAELEAFHNEFFNEAISLERGLPWRARFIPHPEQPALLFSVHHIVGDGRSMFQMVSAIMARLSGQAMKPCPLESPSMVPAITPAKWHQWPASIAGWWRNSRRDARAALGQKIITLASRRSPRYTTSAVRYHELACDQAKLRALAKQLGSSANSVVVAVLCNSFLALEPDNPNAVAVIRLSLDLRRFFPPGQQPEFGNFVSSFAVRATRQATLADQVRSIDAQTKEHMARYERRENALPLMVYEWLPIIGRTLYSHFIVKSKAKGSFPPVSCHFSNLGNAEALQPTDPQVRLTELWPSTLSTAVIIGLVSLGGKFLLPIVYQRDETDDPAIDRFRQILDAQLVAIAPPTVATSPATSPA